MDNTSDANKPVSTATQTALDLKANIASPTFTGTVGGITKSMVGLGNVDNTSDTNKPISTATQTALNGKANSNAGVPAGGTTGQVLRKVSNTNYDTEWGTGGSGSVTYGTTAGTATEGNDGRISGIQSGSIVISGSTIVANSEGFKFTGADPILGAIDVSDNGGGILTYSDGGTINTSSGGGSIDTRGTGSIELGVAGTRTTLTGTATADRGIALPDADGTLAISDQSLNTSDEVTFGKVNVAGGDIQIGSIGGSLRITGFGNTIDIEQGLIDGFGFQVPSSDFYILDVIDPTKKAYFDVSGLTTGTERSYAFPDAAGTLALTTTPPASHAHGNITNDGKIGSTANLPLITTTAGAITTGAFGTSANQFCQGNDSRLSDARTPTSHSHGNITNAGAIGSTANLPLITTTSGVVTTGAFGTGATDFAAGNHTHAQLHNQSHAITSTSDHTANNWKVWYSNGSGQVTELALGAANTVLTSNGASSAPTFTAPSAGGSTNLWIPASAWIPRTTTGCGVNSLEASTNKVNYDVLEFDTATQEYAQAAVVMPNNWNAGTITAKFHWTAASGSGGVTFSLAGLALGDNGQIDQAMGTSQSADDTLQTANYVHISPATSAVTLAGSPTAGQFVILELSRVVSASNDTLAVDARFLGAEISFN